MSRLDLRKLAYSVRGAIPKEGPVRLYILSARRSEGRTTLTRLLTRELALIDSRPIRACVDLQDLLPQRGVTLVDGPPLLEGDGLLELRPEHTEDSCALLVARGQTSTLADAKRALKQTLLLGIEVVGTVYNAPDEPRWPWKL